MAWIIRGITGSWADEIYKIGGGQELANLRLIDEICLGVDVAFGRDPALPGRFPDAPAAQGRSTVEPKTFAEDRKGHDRR